jgi:hypothetical protein
MLLQTNSYIVPKEKRSEHARLMRRFRQTLGQLGCDMFEVYEQAGANWNGADTTGRYVQIMRFRDRKHQIAVQNAEKSDPQAQALIAEFCELVNFQYQQQQGFFAVGFYHSVVSSSAAPGTPVAEPMAETEAEVAAAAVPMAETHEPVDESHREPVAEAPDEMVDGQITEVVSDLPVEQPVAIENIVESHSGELRSGQFQDLEEIEEVEAEPLELGNSSGEDVEHHGEIFPADEDLLEGEEPLSEEELLGELSPGTGGEAEFGEHLSVEEITESDHPEPAKDHAEHGAEAVEEPMEAAPERKSFFRRRPR